MGLLGAEFPNSRQGFSMMLTEQENVAITEPPVSTNAHFSSHTGPVANLGHKVYKVLAAGCRVGHVYIRYEHIKMCF